MSTGREGVVAGSARAVFEGSTSIGMDDDQLLGWFIATRSAVAFEALVARHGPMVLGVCRGASRDEPDAQDAFQATFLVLARRAGSIRRRGALAAWLYGVARKIALRARTDAARRRIREREAAARAAAAVGSGRHPADADVEALLEEIDRLPGTYREPIILCYLDGMTYEAAAAHLDCPLGTLSIRLKRARERLRARLTRRGVGIPAGLLAANLGSGVPPVALPAGLNGLAVRAAMAWTTNQATAAGTVPTSVALMAARTMTTMRNQVFAVGLFALGGVAATAAAALALKPTAPPQATRPEPPQAPAPRSWVRAFPNGTTVELVGISAHPSNPGSWRTPDGVPLATPPYHHTAYRAKTEGNRRVWEVAYRVHQPPGQDQSLQVETVPPTSSPSSSQGIDAAGVRLPEIRSQCFDFAGDQAACGIRFGLAAGPWTTDATGTGRDISGRGLARGSSVFGTARRIADRTVITVTRADPAGDMRVAALDRNGTEVGAGSSQSVEVSNFRQIEAEFNLPPAEIAEFRLQSRQYEWQTFDDVVLRPRGDANSPPGGPITP